MHFASMPSLFLKTKKGANMANLPMSRIHTCELIGINPFEYLIILQNHAKEQAACPAAWMPWNYRQALQQAGRSDGFP